MTTTLQKHSLLYVRTSSITNAVPRGFSMTELIWVIAALGVLAGIAISHVGSMSIGAQSAVAREKLEMLNQGLHAYASAVTEITPGVQAVRADSVDEQTVLLYLEYRNPTNPVVGSPFVDPRYRPASSSSTDDFRLVWAGTMFKLLSPGQTGTGLKVPFDSSDMGTPYKYPANFRPQGS